MLEKLSPEQEALMYEHRDEYIDFIVNNNGRSSNIKVEDVRADIDWIYSKASLEKPKFIFISNSYMEEKLMINFILNSSGLLFGLENVKDLIKGAIKSSEAYDNIMEKVEDNISPKIDVQAYDNLRMWIMDKLRTNITNGIEDQVGNKIDKAGVKMAQGAAKEKDPKISRNVENMIYSLVLLEISDKIRERIGTPMKDNTPVRNEINKEFISIEDNIHKDINKEDPARVARSPAVSDLVGFLEREIKAQLVDILKAQVKDQAPKNDRQVSPQIYANIDNSADINIYRTITENTDISTKGEIEKVTLRDILNRIRQNIWTALSQQVNSEISEKSMGNDTKWGVGHKRVYDQASKNVKESTFDEISSKLFWQVKQQIDINIGTTVTSNIEIRRRFTSEMEADLLIEEREKTNPDLQNIVYLTVWSALLDQIRQNIGRDMNNSVKTDVVLKTVSTVQDSNDLADKTAFESRRSVMGTIWSTIFDQIRTALASRITDEESRKQSSTEVKFGTWDIADTIANHISVNTNMESWTEVRDGLFNAIDRAIRDEIGQNITGSVNEDIHTQRNEIWNEMVDNVVTNLLVTIYGATEDVVYEFLYQNLCREIKNETINNMQGKKMEFIEQEFGVPWNSWLSFYSYFQKIGIVTSQDFDRYYKFMRKGIWSIQFFKHWCILTPLPNKIHRDNQNRLHSVDSSAVEWMGSKHSDHHFIHGVSFPDKQLWERVVTGKITAKEVLSEVDNMEQRNAILSVFPPDKMIKELNAELISTHKQKKKGKGLLKAEDYKVYEHKPIKLYKIDPATISSELPNEMIYVLFYTDPSTGREYFSYIEPRAAKDAASAMAWKFGLTKEQYLNNVVAET